MRRNETGAEMLDAMPVVWGSLRGRGGTKSVIASEMTRQRPRFRGAAGFTLVETLVVLLILAVLVALLFMPMYQVMTMLNQTATTSQAQDALNHVAMLLQRDLEEAQFVMPVPLAGYASPKDELVLARLDLFLPPIDPSTGGIVYPQQVYGWPAPNPANPSTWLPGSGRVVRYFVAPLPDQPAGRMWGVASDPRSGYMNPFVSDPANPTAMGPLADPARGNMATLYRIQFDLNEAPFNDTANLNFAAMFASEFDPAGNYPTSVRGPYFYLSTTQVTWGAGLVPLGSVFRDLAEPLSPARTADCGRYAWSDMDDSYQPVLWGASQRGVLPGFAAIPELVSDVVARPDQESLPTAPRDVVSYRAPNGMWVAECVDPDNNPLTFDEPPAWFMRLQNAGTDITDGVDDLLDPWDDSGLLYFLDARELPPRTFITEKQVTLLPRYNPANGGFPRPYYYRMVPMVDEATGSIRFSRRAVTDAWFDGASMVGTTNPMSLPPTFPLAPANPTASVNWQYQLTFGRDPLVWPFSNSLFEPIDVVNMGNIVARRFKVVEGSEVVRLISRAGPRREWNLVRTTAEPGPGQYRIHPMTGVIEFNKASPPDTNNVLIVVEYDFRDNFRWMYRVPGGAEWEAEPSMTPVQAAEVYARDDSVTVTYSTRERQAVRIGLAAYSESASGPQVVSVTRSLVTKNGPR